jgi:hypothetical protein
MPAAFMSRALSPLPLYNYRQIYLYGKLCAVERSHSCESFTGAFALARRIPVDSAVLTAESPGIIHAWSDMQV